MNQLTEFCQVHELKRTPKAYAAVNIAHCHQCSITALQKGDARVAITSNYAPAEGSVRPIFAPDFDEATLAELELDISIGGSTNRVSQPS